MSPKALLKNAGPYDPRQMTRVRPSDGRGFYDVSVNYYLDITARVFTRWRAERFANQVDAEWRIKFLNRQEEMGDYYKDHWWPSEHQRQEYKGLVAECGCHLDEGGFLIAGKGALL